MGSVAEVGVFLELFLWMILRAWTMSSAQCSPVRLVVYFVQGCRPGAVPFALRAYGSMTTTTEASRCKGLETLINLSFPLYGGGGGGVPGGIRLYI